MTLAADNRCLMSRYDDGSSNMYTSACRTAAMAIANRCSSPPESCPTSRSSSLLSSSSFWRKSRLDSSACRSSILPTVMFGIFMLRGIWSTYCGFVTALMSSSSTLVKKFCSSDPRKYFKISVHSGGSSYLPRFGLSLPERILRAVDLPIPFVPTRPSTWPGRGVGSRCSLKALAEYR